MEFQKEPIANIELLIRKPVAQVFDAFVNPDVITKIWFNRSTGPLEEGKSVRWYWDKYDASSEVRVLALEHNRRIYIEWDANTDNPSNVEWKFEPRSDETTYVSVKHKGIVGTGDAVVEKLVDSTGGFALVLAAAKAYLEHGIQLNIVFERKYL